MKVVARTGARSALLVILAVVLVAAGALVAYRLISGRSLGLRSYAGSLLRFGRTVVSSRAITRDRQGRFTSIIFLHHSVGENLIEQGGVRDAFTQAGYAFWDHGYNQEGLRDPSGHLLGIDYRVPDDNTDPDGLWRIFHQTTYGLPLNTWSALLQHEVIIVKSCYPASAIASDERLAQYKAWYLEMRDVMDRHPDHLFIVLSPPPLNPAETNLDEATRARAFARWLASDEFLRGHSNVAVFDLFDALAEGDAAAPDYSMLRAAYRQGDDSHPNRLANETLGPQFVDAILTAVESYRAIADETDAS